MRKQRLIQLLQYLCVRVGIWLFVVFVMEKSFIDFVLKYWVLFLIATVSYFYYYSIQYEVDKKHGFIRSMLLYGNLYLFVHVFFRPLLGISHELFVLLGLVILGLWGTTKMTSRWKWVLQVLGGIISFCILISGIFYLYPDEPDIIGFFNTRGYVISVHGISEQVDKKDAYIRILWNKRGEDFAIEPGFYKELMMDCKISYPSLKKDRDEKLLLTTPEGDIYVLYPQSELQIDFSGRDIEKITIVNGKFGFLSGLFTSSIDVVGERNILLDEELLGLRPLQEGYNEELVNYLKDQISGGEISLANNDIMYNIDGKIIKFLSLIFPTSYSKNLRNYNEFQKYFSLVVSDIGLSGHPNVSEYGVQTISLWENLRDNIGAGKGSWYLF